MNYNNYIELISGQSKGFFAGVFYIILIAASKIYAVIIRLRNFFYNKHIFAIHEVEAKVISIGNITAGGTGKTPLVIWLCNILTAEQRPNTKDCKLAILTRGYKIKQNKDQRFFLADEPAILAENCPKTNIVINPNRVIGAAEAIGKYDANVLVLDDGFQHRRLARDLDIVTIDATCPFGYGRIIPAGLLREPLNSLKRADAIVITRCDQTSEAQLSQIEDKLRNINPKLLIARSIHKPFHIKTIDNRQLSLEHFKNKKVFAFCGIGNPDSFINSLKNMDYDIVGTKIYDDHHNYTENCLADLRKESQNMGSEIILTTQKDWTKIRRLESVKDLPLTYLVIEIKFLTGEDRLRCLIEDALTGKISRID
ncbi:MAG: tetraacyldisaccharide 4'-kinase [Sedimentisphaerales bacterium]|nr:tetraacyldisaccharide 4'-kinase [Sedimentisphaerales bacterium]